MFKNWIIIIFSVVLLAICLRTVSSALSCYSCGSATFECENLQDVKKVKCGFPYSNCANLVKFSNNGTSKVLSAFCYGRLKDDNELDCRTDVSMGHQEGVTCKIICTSDFCNHPINKHFVSPARNDAHEHEYQTINKPSHTTTPSEKLKLDESVSFSSLNCCSSGLLVLFSLFTSFMYYRV